MDIKIVALHKHWITADAVKQFVSSNVIERGSEEFPAWFKDLGNMASMFARMSVWYALLYVVVEGFRELNLSHPEVEELLKNEEYLDSLRLFRNATFHYQKNPLTEKAWRFLLAKDSEIWIKHINDAFEKFFFENLPLEQFVNEIKGKDA
ncbi:MAG: hypothetical protein HQK59_08730 [Deltaproteobacteria bacterium]|nr:hypothetical protein [Deltaproteobacteria bacterium]